MMGNVIGNLIGWVISFTITVKILFFMKDSDPTRRVTFREVIKKHQQFPKIQIWNYVLRTSTSRVPVFILAAFFDSATVGFFTFSMGIASMPIRILGTSIAQVFYPMAAQEWKESQQATRAIDNAVKFQATIGI